MGALGSLGYTWVFGPCLWKTLALGKALSVVGMGPGFDPGRGEGPQVPETGGERCYFVNELNFTLTPMYVSQCLIKLTTTRATNLWE